MAVEIPLTQNEYAIVDKEYADLVSCYKWHLNSSGYAIRALPRIRGNKTRKFQLMHRYLYEQVKENIPQGLQIDHIDGNRLNNQINNLRVVTHRENCINRKTERIGASASQYHGVWKSSSGKKWNAMISLNKHTRYLGCFNTEIEASMAYQKAFAEISVSEQKAISIHISKGYGGYWCSIIMDDLLEIKILNTTNKDEAIKHLQSIYPNRTFKEISTQSYLKIITPP